MLKRIEELESRLGEKYEKVEINGENCFRTNKGEIIHLVGFKKWEAIVVEYAKTQEAAERNVFEDGDLFYMDELDEKQMFEAMIKEIEG